MRPGDLVARGCTRPAICFSGFAGMMSGARRHDGVGAAGPALEPKRPGQDEDSRGSRGRRSSSTAILPNLVDVVVVVVVDVVAVVVFVVVVLLRTLRPDAPPAHAQVHREQGLLGHRPR